MIKDDSKVTIEYNLRDYENNIIDTSRDKEMLTFRMGEKRLFKKIENELLGKEKNDCIEIELSPVEAFGEIDENLIQKVPRKNFNNIIDVYRGMQIRIDSQSGVSFVTVVDYDNEFITVDANHPFAGKFLKCEIYIADVK
jgi:FKBP-type peptidyl-prolyl cis-trans isomerase SlyD